MKGLAAVLVCAALALAACGGGDGDPPADADPLADVPEVRAVVDAVLARDANALAQLVALRQFPCTEVEGTLGEPPCAAGEAEGTVIDALPLAQCTTRFTRAHELARAFAFNETVALYAVYGSNGAYGAVFTEAPEAGLNEFGINVGIDHGSITYIDYGCGQTAGQLVQNVDDAEFLIAPPAADATPAPTPAP